MTETHGLRHFFTAEDIKVEKNIVVEKFFFMCILDLLLQLIDNLSLEHVRMTLKLFAEALCKVLGEIDVELRDVALQDSAYIHVKPGEDTTQINVHLSFAQPNVGVWVGGFSPANLKSLLITNYSNIGDLHNGRHICTTRIKYISANYSTPGYTLTGRASLTVQIINQRVNAVCEEHTINDENKIYKFNLAASSHKYPHGVLSLVGQALRQKSNKFRAGVCDYFLNSSSERPNVVRLAETVCISLTPQEEYLTIIHVRSKLHYFPLIKDRLNEDHRAMFHTTCFEPWLDITYVKNDDGMIHYVLQKQCCSDDDSFDLPLINDVNGHSLHFRNGDIPFCNMLFPENIGYDVKIIDVLALLEDEEKFSKVSNEDAIRVCLFLFLEGEHIWRQLYDSIRNVSSKHKLEHLVGLRKNSNHVPSYSLTGFLFAFNIWIIESYCVLDSWWTKVPEIIPRALSWRRKAKFNKWEYFSELFHKAPIELAPTKDELQSMVSLYPTRGVKREETLKKVSPQTEDFYRSHQKMSRTLKMTHLPNSMEQLANQKNVLNPLMIEKCKSLKPWIEDLARLFKRIDKIFLSHDLEECLSRSVVGHLKKLMMGIPSVVFEDEGVFRGEDSCGSKGDECV
nr:hypothetical protein [Tanacetum cinerariifolium]